MTDPATSPLTLTMTRFVSGCWEGRLTCAGPRTSAPELALSQDGLPLDPPELTALPGENQAWAVRCTLPASILSEGVSVLLISDAQNGDVLARLPILAGTDLADDLRGEVALLRAELDQLRGAFQDMMRAGPEDN